MRNRLIAPVVTIVLGVSAAIWQSPDAHGGACVRTWDDSIGVLGANSPINTFLIRDEGGTPVLYAGGRFTQIGGVSAGKVGRWNGVQWSPLGTGISGVGAAVHALTEFDEGNGSLLFAGGEFDSAGGHPASRLARWNGSTWSDVAGGVNGSVFSLAVFDDGTGEALYVGGGFSQVGGADAAHIARWDGEAWSVVGDGLDGNVLALTVFDDGNGPALYAGGEFSASAATEVSHIARWNGVAWTALATGLNGPAFSFAAFHSGNGTRLYVGGTFTDAAGVAASSIVSWNGTSFASVGGGMDGAVRALTAFDDGTGVALYAGGVFQQAGGAPASRIARWNGSSWSTLAQGANSAVFALAPAAASSAIGPGLYAGGSFSAAGNQPSKYIARWVDCGDPPGDVNGDGSINLLDFTRFSSCLRGPQTVVQPACHDIDMNFDGDVDLRDVHAFGNLFTGNE